MKKRIIFFALLLILIYGIYVNASRLYVPSQQGSVDCTNSCDDGCSCENICAYAAKPESEIGMIAKITCGSKCTNCYTDKVKPQCNIECANFQDITEFEDCLRQCCNKALFNACDNLMKVIHFINSLDQKPPTVSKYVVYTSTTCPYCTDTYLANPTGALKRCKDLKTIRWLWTSDVSTPLTQIKKDDWKSGTGPCQLENGKQKCICKETWLTLPPLTQTCTPTVNNNWCCTSEQCYSQQKGCLAVCSGETQYCKIPNGDNKGLCAVPGDECTCGTTGSQDTTPPPVNPPANPPAAPSGSCSCTDAPHCVKVCNEGFKCNGKKTCSCGGPCTSVGTAQPVDEKTCSKLGGTCSCSSNKCSETLSGATDCKDSCCKTCASSDGGGTITVPVTQTCSQLGGTCSSDCENGCDGTISGASDCSNSCCSKCKGGCPSIYTLDNKNNLVWQDDSSHGFFSKNLEAYHYKELNPFVGYVIIKENVEETTYINSVELIETGDKSNIMADDLGGLHTIGELNSIACVDSKRKDCSHMVFTQDSQIMPYFDPIPEAKKISESDYGTNAWVSDISDIEDKSALDYLEITLPKTDKKQAKLFLVLSETGLLNYGEVRMITKIGKDLFYAVIESPIVGKIIGEKITKSSKITVKILDKNNQWKDYPVDYNTVTGVYATKIIPLDMSLVKDNKVRLEFWRFAYAFDYIAVDYSDDEKIQYKLVSPKSAIKNSKEDVLALVTMSDDKYATIQEGDEIKFTFNTKVDKKYFLKLGSYYQPLVMRNAEKTPSSYDALLKNSNFVAASILNEGYGEKSILVDFLARR
ncbi:MAG: hypothetical protein V1859_10720 [archaeon]